RSCAFNSPYGACEECSGLGNKWAFDPAKVIEDPSKPLCEGALGPGAGSTYMQHTLADVARQQRIDLSTPFENLPRKTQALLLEGGNGFPGILKILQNTFDDASEEYRAWLTDYMSPVECDVCHGKRLRPSSLAVRVQSFSIAEFTALPISRALLTVRN